jgi:hypothetical protein
VPGDVAGLVEGEPSQLRRLRDKRESDFALSEGIAQQEEATAHGLAKGEAEHLCAPFWRAVTIDDQALDDTPFSRCCRNLVHVIERNRTVGDMVRFLNYRRTDFA